MNGSLETRQLIDGLRDDKFSFEEVTSACAHIQVGLPPKTTLHKDVERVIKGSGLGVNSLLAHLYEHAFAYAEELNFMLLNIKEKQVRYALFENFADKKDFRLILTTGEKVVVEAFYFPFDTLVQLKKLQGFLSYLHGFKKGTEFTLDIEIIKSTQRRKYGYLAGHLNAQLDDFDEETVCFFNDVFSGFPEESAAFSKGKKVKIVFKNDTGSFSEELSNQEDTITLYERVQEIQKKLTGLVEEGNKGYKYEIEVLG